MEENKDLNLPEENKDLNVPEENQNQNLDLPEGDAQDITFDYNQLYGGGGQPTTETPQEQPVETTPTMEETPIVFEEEKPQPTPEPIVRNVVPTFDTSALEDDLPDELKPKVEEPLIQSVVNETQKEKQEGRQNLMFLIVFFAVLIIAVLVIFPLMLGI